MKYGKEIATGLLSTSLLFSGCNSKTGTSNDDVNKTLASDSNISRELNVSAVSAYNENNNTENNTSTGDVNSTTPVPTPVPTPIPTSIPTPIPIPTPAPAPVENHNPVIDDLILSDANLTEGQDLNSSVIASDRDGDDLSYRTEIDGQISLDQNSSFSGLSVGEHNLTAYVSDGQGGEANKTVGVRVNEIVEDNNTPPVLDSVDVLGDSVDYDLTYEGTDYYSIAQDTDENVTFTVNGYDDDGDTLKIVVNGVEQDGTTSYSEILNLQENERRDYNITETDGTDYSNEKYLTVYGR